MLFRGRWHKVLRFDDINSLPAFEAWLKDNLSLYADDEKVSDDNLRVLLEYVKNKSKEQNVERKREWFDKVDGLIGRIKSLKDRKKAEIE